MATPPFLPSENGLGGLAAPLATPPLQPQEQAEQLPPVSGPATEGPANPGQTVARHILDALGGGSGGSMDWAKGILAGGLAGAANVGKAPEGAGALYGASKGVQGTLEIKRQQALDKQRANQQAFENQEKLKADTRAERELSIHEADAQAQRAMWTAETAGMTQRQNEDAAKFEQWKKLAPFEVKKAEAAYEEEQTKLDQSRGEMIGLVEAVTGKSISSFPLVTSTNDLTSEHAQQLGAAYIFPVHNGETHTAGEDRVGAYLVPGHYWEEPIKKPFEFTNSDGKKITAQPGTTLGTLAGVIMGKQKAADDAQKRIMNGLDVQAKQAQIRHENVETNNAILSGQLLKKQLEDPDGMTPKEIHQLQKAGQSESSKTQKDFNTFLQSANSIEGSIKLSKNGNQLAAAIAPLQETLFITTAEGVKRINETELSQVSGAGNIVRRGQNAYEKFLHGDISEGTKRDLVALIETYKTAKYQQYLNNEDVTAKNYRLGDNQSVFDMNGKPTTLGEARKKMATETPTTEAPKVGDTNTHLGATYKFDGKVWVKQ